MGGSQYLANGGWETHPVGGSTDDDYYKTQRIGWKEYRVSEIPNGPYLLTLRFEEQILHGPGLSVFDVAVEGQKVLDDFDIWAQVGRYYALNRRFAVTVADGELNVAAVPTQGETRLSALELTPRDPIRLPPPSPRGWLRPRATTRSSWTGSITKRMTLPGIMFIGPRIHRGPTPG